MWRNSNATELPVNITYTADFHCEISGVNVVVTEQRSGRTEENRFFLVKVFFLACSFALTVDRGERLGPSGGGAIFSRTPNNKEAKGKSPGLLVRFRRGCWKTVVDFGILPVVRDKGKDFATKINDSSVRVWW